MQTGKFRRIFVLVLMTVGLLSLTLRSQTVVRADLAAFLPSIPTLASTLDELHKQYEFETASQAVKKSSTFIDFRLDGIYETVKQIADYYTNQPIN